VGRGAGAAAHPQGGPPSLHRLPAGRLRGRVRPALPAGAQLPRRWDDDGGADALHPDERGGRSSRLHRRLSAGINGDWNVGFEQDYDTGTDDVGFTEALLDTLAVRYRVDTTRVYATGLSRGGFFAQRLAAELSHRIAAIAAVGAPLPIPVQARHRARGPLRPIGVMEIHGTEDQVVHHDGKAEAYLSADSSVAYWVACNALLGARAVRETVAREPADSTSVTIRTVGADPPRVVQVTVHGGGHTWPGADPFNVGLPIGRTTRDVVINDLMWAFFQRHVR
jgi:polyhydroxybutyrate depolymerase